MTLSKKQYALQEAKWLTKIPMDWHPFRLKEIARVSPPCSGNGPNEKEACSVIPMEVVTEKGSFNDYETEDYGIIPSGLTNFEEGDVVFAKITPCMENGKGAFVEKLKTKYAFGSTEFHVLRPNYLIDGKFLYYYSFDPEYRKYAAENMTGAAGQKRVSTRFIEYTPVFLPGISEQKRIALFLEQHCATIDKTIEIKKEQLTILEGLRKSITHKAVTKGLDDKIKLRKSGIELFGEIPKHWMIDRLKDILVKRPDAMKVGPFGSDLTYADMVDEGIKVYNQRTVIDNAFENGDFYITPDKYQAMKAFEVFPQDVLITTRGTIGRCAIVPSDAERGILHPCLIRVQTDKTRMFPEYLSILIQDSGFILTQLEMMSATTTIGVIYSEKLKRVYLPVPPLEEQSRIVDYLEQKNAEIRSTMSNTENQIKTLEKYRNSLIHECVTGKQRITDKDLKELENV